MLANGNDQNTTDAQNGTSSQSTDSQSIVAEQLLAKIRTRQAKVAIIGLGYVGLPLAVTFAEAGFRTVGIDINEELIDRLNAGISTVADVPSERLEPLLPSSKQTARSWNGAGIFESSTDGDGGDQNEIPGHTIHRNGNGDGDSERTQHGLGEFYATTDYDVLLNVDAVIICVPTPLSTTKDPDMTYIITATDEITQRLHNGMVVVLESTTYPGTTEEIVLPRLQQVKFQHEPVIVGKDFFLAFSPERIDPGRKDWTVHNTPKVIGGVTPQCLIVAQSLYECAIEQIVPVSKPTTAEMVKLLENTFRAVNIALINEVAIMCDRLDVDVWEVIEAANTKPFGFMPFYPGPGLGGHCIPIDPHYLAWKMKTLNYNARFIQLAEEINFGMPHYVLGKISDALNDVGRSLKDARILILGVTYKPDMGDLRESPALDLIKLLIEKGSKVEYHDPFASQIVIDGWIMERVELTEQALQASDCVVITTVHSSLDWSWIIEKSKLVIDTRNATANFHSPSTRIVKL